MDRNVVVLGGGIGGVVAASRLAGETSSLGWGGRVMLVDRDLDHPFAPSFPWVMSGARRPEQVTADLRSLRRRGVELVHGDVLQIDPEHRVVQTTHGPVDYARLVIALGAELAPQGLPGFSEGAHNVYSLEGVAAAGRALRSFDGGRLAVVISRLPYKCPAAPYEIALVADAVLRGRGVRDRVSIDVYTPEPYPMPTAGPAIGQELTALLSERAIGLHPQVSVDAIEPAARELVFADGARASYDLLFGVPPHRAPEAIRDSDLAGDTGFLPVDPRTLAAQAEGVFGIGDVVQIPIADGKFLPRAGVFATAQAKVVALRIGSEIAGRRPTATFDGRGSCLVEIGGGKAVHATGDFYDGEGPRVRMHRAGRRWHLAKVALERRWMRRWFRR
jgi:sulfide:quinone oxidoreductase